MGLQGQLIADHNVFILIQTKPTEKYGGSESMSPSASDIRCWRPTGRLAGRY
jgi:hypothetical protein